MICQLNLSGYLTHTSEKRMQVIIIFLIFVIQYLFEHLLPANKKYNDKKNEIRNVSIGIINALLLFIPSALLVELLIVIEKNKIGLLQSIQLPFWINAGITIILMDLAMYWWHRFNHTKKFLWRFHQFHHKDEKMNTTTAVRFHILELLLSVVFKIIVFLLIGFSFMPILIYESIFFVAVVIHHSNISIGTNLDMQYRKLFSSPLMHRIHHSINQNETDTNYGSVFSFWDRLFNTYKKEAVGNIIFGVVEKKVPEISKDIVSRM